MTFRSPHSYADFAKSVLRDYRFARTGEQEEFLASVAATSRSRAVTLKTGLFLWRAQLGHDWRAIEQDGVEYEVEAAFPPTRMKPLPEKASDGRANPRGIAFLYLATKKETAVLEVRPLMGSYVSVAQFEVRRDLQLVDCSFREAGNLAFLEKNLTSDDIEKIVWTEVNKAFSEPVTRADDGLDYVPTQIIAEFLKLKGFDGIAYKSSYGEDGFNIALFDLSAADLLTCGLHRVKDVSVVLSEADSPYFVTKQPQASP